MIRSYQPQLYDARLNEKLLSCTSYHSRRFVTLLGFLSLKHQKLQIVGSLFY